jgi:hypothetical protein
MAGRLGKSRRRRAPRQCKAVQGAYARQGISGRLSKAKQVRAPRNGKAGHCAYERNGAEVQGA